MPTTVRGLSLTVWGIPLSLSDKTKENGVSSRADGKCISECQTSERRVARVSARVLASHSGRVVCESSHRPRTTRAPDHAASLSWLSSVDLLRCGSWFLFYPEKKIHHQNIFNLETGTSVPANWKGLISSWSSQWRHITVWINFIYSKEYITCKRKRKKKTTKKTNAYAYGNFVSIDTQLNNTNPRRFFSPVMLFGNSWIKDWLVANDTFFFSSKKNRTMCISLCDESIDSVY